MGRGPRRDWPGAWHHVINRGIARRTVFETSRDIGVFCNLLAEVSAEGLLEVHVYSFLTTHFHLLVRSPEGRLSEAMRWVENGYVRTFNRSRRRDGALFRGRFWSRPIESDVYWWAVLRYIDRNPLEAGLAARSVDYPYGSAWWYSRGSGPSWLVRGVVEESLGIAAGPGTTPRTPYPVEERGDGGNWTAEFVERRLRGGSRAEDPLADLVRAAPSEVQAWMLRKALLADGTPPGWVLLSSAGLRKELESRGELGAAMLPGMLRLYCGLTYGETAAVCGLTIAATRRRVDSHQRGVAEDGNYRATTAAVLRAVLDREAGSRRPSVILPIRLPAVAPPPTAVCS